MESCFEGRHKHKELGEESCKRWNSCQREQTQCHDESQFGVGIIEGVVVADIDFSAALLDDVHDDKYTEVGYEVNKNIVDNGCHAFCCAAHHAHDHITGLGDGRKRHESFHVVLSHGKDIGQG